MSPDSNVGGSNGWDEWRNHILLELKDNGETHKCIMEKLTKIDHGLTELQIKSGVWGLMGGLIPVLIVAVFWMIRYLEGK